MLYKEGKKEGKERFYAEDGLLLGEGEYKKGKPIGKHWRNHSSKEPAYLALYDNKGKLLQPICEYATGHRKTAEYSLEDEKVHGLFRVWSEDGQLLQEKNFLHGELDGEQHEYYANGRMKLSHRYVAGKQDGMQQEWFENGKASLAVCYKDGQLDGPQKRWYEDGQLQEEASYQNGVQHGIQRQWYDNGHLRIEKPMTQGQLNGTLRSWSPTGQIVFEKSYRDGKEDGLTRSWHENGTPAEVATFKAGKLEGSRELFHPTGVKALLCYYKEGNLIDDIWQWDQDGSVLMEGRYDAGHPVGQLTHYYPKADCPPHSSRVRQKQNFDVAGMPDGVQESFYPSGRAQGLLEYSHGELDGRRALWDADGNLMEEAHYRQGKLDGYFFQRAQDGRELVYHYKEGKKEGPHQIYYPRRNGAIAAIKAIEMNFHQDLPHGDCLEYNEEGMLISLTPFVAGKKEGKAVLFAPEGEPIMEVDFAQDKRHGRSVEYFPGRKLHREVFYVEDRREGEERIYSEKGALVGLYIYLHDQLHGLCKSWSDEGILTFEGEYKEGKRHGRLNKYYPNGEPQLLQVYQDDQLEGVKKSFDANGLVTESEFRAGKKIR